jgi:hypothetical protein
MENIPMKPKRPRDTNQLAKSIVDLATGQISETIPEEDTRNPHAVALGRLGGLRGGAARAKSLSKVELVRIAKKAARTRWAKKKKIKRPQEVYQ